MSRVLAIMALIIGFSLVPALTQSVSADQDYGYGGGYSSGCDTIRCGSRRTSGEGGRMWVAYGEPVVAGAYELSGYAVRNAPCYTSFMPADGWITSGVAYPYPAEVQFSDCSWFRPLPYGSQAPYQPSYGYGHHGYRYDSQPVTCYNRRGQQVAC